MKSGDSTEEKEEETPLATPPATPKPKPKPQPKPTIPIPDDLPPQTDADVASLHATYAAWERAKPHILAAIAEDAQQQAADRQAAALARLQVLLAEVQAEEGSASLAETERGRYLFTGRTAPEDHDPTTGRWSATGRHQPAAHVGSRAEQAAEALRGLGTHAHGDAHGGQGGAVRAGEHHWTPGDVAHAPTVEQIKGILAKSEGMRNDELLLHIGHMVRDRIHAEMGHAYHDLHEADQLVTAAHAGRLTPQEQARYEALLGGRQTPERFNALAARLERAYDVALREQTVRVLGQLRALGGEHPVVVEMQPGEPVGLRVKTALEETSDLLPHDWLVHSNNAGAIYTERDAEGETARAGYAHLGPLAGMTGAGRIGVREELAANPATLGNLAAHEMGHRFEYTVPGISRYEATFYDRRTRGETEGPIREYPGLYKRDQWLDPYMGRVYAPRLDVRTAAGTNIRTFELLSRGQEWLLGPTMGLRPRLWRDAEYHAFVLGLLTAA